MLHSIPVQADDRLPPNAIDAEEAVLGGVLFDPNAIERIADILPVDAFYIGQHQTIYRAALALYNASEPIDLMTVCRWLNDHGSLDAVGGQNRILELFDRVVTAVNIDFYAELILEKWKRRQVIQAASEINAIARNLATPYPQVQEQAEQKIFALSESAKQAGLKPLGDLLSIQLGLIESMQDGEVFGCSTGFYDLDEKLNGLKPGKLYIVAGRPGMGKSGFAAAIARNVAAQGLPTAIFSLEMSGGEIANRLWASETELDTTLFENGQFKDRDWALLADKMQRLAELPIAIDESQSVSPISVLTQCRKFKAERGGLGLVVVDYLHLMLDSDEDDVKAIGKITRAFKLMSRELNVPILLLSQLNRAVESRNDKRPMMSDLRQSGAIEQDADAILFLYRDEVYNPETGDRGIAEVIVAKNRSGKTGKIRLLFEPQFVKFRNLARGRYD